MSLFDMPPEILCYILSLLDPKTLLGSSSVCRAWLEIIRGTPRLEYKIQLWTDGLSTGMSDFQTAAAGLQAIRQRRRAWRNLEWGSQNVIDMPGLQASKAYDLINGVLAIQDGSGSFWTRSLDDDPAAASSTKHFAALGIGIDSDTFEDFVIDPTQDLLVVLYHTADDVAGLAFLTLSQHESHPMARYPTLTLEVDSYPLQVSMQIADDMIGLCSCLPGRLRIWNWRKGELLCNLYNRRGNFPSFQFLSPRSFVLGVPGKYFRIDIYVIHEGSPDRAFRAAALGLPEITDRWFLRAIEIHSGPFCARPAGRSSFDSDNTARIYLFWLEYVDHSAAHERRYVRLFVHHRTLYHYVSQHLRKGRLWYCDLLWNEWGPQSTRVLEGNPYRLTRHVHGERALFPDPEGNSLHLLDFGVFPGHPEPDTGSGTLIMGPSTLSGDNMPFKDTLTTYLPFRRATRQMDTEYEAFVMDQDHIVGVNPSINEQMTVFTLR